MEVVFGGPGWCERLSAALPPLLLTAIALCADVANLNRKKTSGHDAVP
jgi:hypothetical protein